VGQSLDNFGRRSEAMEILENQQGRAFGAGQGVDRLDGSERVGPTGIGRLFASGNLQALSHVPSGQLPALIAGNLGDLTQSGGMLTALYPQPRETGRNVFDKLVRERHNWVLGGRE